MSSQAVASRGIVELMGLQSPKEHGDVVNFIRQAYSEKPKKKGKPKDK